jgi:hypothetical protein
MAECRIVSARTVVDPEERDRRLSRVYTLLLDLAARREAAERKSAGSESLLTTEDTLAAQG